MTATGTDAAVLTSELARVAKPFVDWLCLETSPDGRGEILPQDTPRFPGRVFNWAVWGRSFDSTPSTGPRDELYDQIILSGELLYSWQPVRVVYADCAAHVAVWRLLADPDSLPQLRVSPPGLSLLLALLCVDGDSQRASAAAAVVESVALEPGDEICLFVVLEHLIRTNPERLSLEYVRKAVRRCHWLAVSPLSLRQQLDTHRIAPVVQGTDWFGLLGHEPLHVEEHLVAAYCDEPDPFPSARLKAWIHELAEGLQTHPDALAMVSRVQKRIIDVANSVDSAAVRGELAELGKSTGLDELYEWSR